MVVRLLYLATVRLFLVYALVMSVLKIAMGATSSRVRIPGPPLHDQRISRWCSGPTLVILLLGHCLDTDSRVSAKGASRRLLVGRTKHSASGRARGPTCLARALVGTDTAVPGQTGYAG